MTCRHGACVNEQPKKNEMTDSNSGATSVNVIGPVPPDPEQLTN